MLNQGRICDYILGIQVEHDHNFFLFRNIFDYLQWL